MAARGSRCNESLIIKIKDHEAQTRHSSGVGGASPMTLGIIGEKYLQSQYLPEELETGYHRTQTLDVTDSWDEVEMSASLPSLQTADKGKRKGWIFVLL